MPESPSELTVDVTWTHQQIDHFNKVRTGGIATAAGLNEAAVERYLAGSSDYLQHLVPGSEQTDRLSHGGPCEVHFGYLAGHNFIGHTIFDIAQEHTAIKLGTTEDVASKVEDDLEESWAHFITTLDDDQMMDYYSASIGEISRIRGIALLIERATDATISLREVFYEALLQGIYCRFLEIQEEAGVSPEDTQLPPDFYRHADAHSKDFAQKLAEHKNPFKRAELAATVEAMFPSLMEALTTLSLKRDGDRDLPLGHTETHLRTLLRRRVAPPKVKLGKVSLQELQEYTKLQRFLMEQKDLRVLIDVLLNLNEAGRIVLAPQP